MYFSLQHFFICDKRDEFLKKVVESASNYVGLNLKVSKETTSSKKFWEEKFGKYR